MFNFFGVDLIIKEIRVVLIRSDVNTNFNVSLSLTCRGKGDCVGDV